MPPAHHNHVLGIEETILLSAYSSIAWAVTILLPPPLLVEGIKHQYGQGRAGEQ
jgi:hypothetical protein